LGNVEMVHRGQRSSVHILGSHRKIKKLHLVPILMTENLKMRTFSLFTSMCVNLKIENRFFFILKNREKKSERKLKKRKRIGKI
jgi:hypothetical protein